MDLTGKEEKDNLLLIGFILLVAAALRFYNLYQIPFTHDEFSAIFRTHFSSFSELIERGVKPDGHPAGVQIFLYYYTKLFGYKEWVVKLPFILAGTISVFLVYLIGKKWFGTSAGLISAAFMATLEYTVMYSQIARPYTSGLLFCLLMVYFWHKVVFEPRRFPINLLLYVLMSALCTYNHYFSLLFAIIVGLTGVFFINRDRLLWYILAGIAIIILFLPHFRIFLYQFLEIGGVGGWLGPPENSFFFTYIAYVFHFSWFVFSVVILLLVSRFLPLFPIEEVSENKRFILISFLWFLLPFGFGFFYSIFVNPVLQESCLLFSFPFLLLALFGLMKEKSFKFNIVAVSVALIVNVATLIFERDYYALFYNSAYKGIVEDTHRVSKEKKGNIVSIVDSHKKISRYYIRQMNLDSSFIWYDRFIDKKSFINFIQNQTCEYLSYGCISGEDRVIPAIILDYYPNLISQSNYYNGIFYLFGKKPETENEIKYTHAYGFESPSKKWIGDGASGIVNGTSHSGQKSFKLNGNIEFSPVFEEQLSKIVKNRNDYIDISFWVSSRHTLKDVMLVATLKSGSEMKAWLPATLEDYQTVDGDSWFKVYLSVKLSDIQVNLNNTVLNVYIWNHGKKEFVADDFEIRQRNGNPFIYGLFREIEYNRHELNN